MHIVHFLQSFSKLDVILKLKIVKFGDRRTNRPTIVVMKLLPQLKIDISLFFCDFFLFFWLYILIICVLKRILHETFHPTTGIPNSSSYCCCPRDDHFFFFWLHVLSINMFCLKICFFLKTCFVFEYVLSPNMFLFRFDVS